MATLTLNGTLTLDQSAGDLETGDDEVAVGVTEVSGDGNDVLTGSLDSDFLTYLNALPATQLTDAQMAFAALVEGASDPAFVTVTPGTGELISNIYFSDSDGAAFNGDRVYQDDGVTPLLTVNNQSIYLWSSADKKVVLATTGSATDPVVAAFYIESTNATNTTAKVEMITFIPIAHPDASNPDDTIDFSSIMRVSATTSLEFPFDVLKPSEYLWVGVGSTTAAVIASGYNLDVDETNFYKKTSISDKIVASNGGSGTTIGLNNQLLDNSGETVVMTLVTGLTALSGTNNVGTDYLNDPNQANKAPAGMDYSGYLDVIGAGILISQSQGNNPKNLDINVFHAGGATNTPEDSSAYIGTEPHGAFDDDQPVAVATVTIIDDDGIVVGTWTIGTPGTGQYANGYTLVGHTSDNGTANITVTIGGNDANLSNDNNIDVNGLLGGYSVNWTVAPNATLTGTTFNRFHVVAEGGQFDIGKVVVTEGGRTHVNIGDFLQVDDDGPATVVALVSGTVDEDGVYEGATRDGGTGDGLAGGTGDVGGEVVVATGAAGSVASLFQSGTDQPLTYSLSSSTAARASLTNQSLTSGGVALSYWVVGDTLTARAGAIVTSDPVFTFQLLADGSWTFTLIDQLDHAAGFDENDLTIQLGALIQATDKDNDSVTYAPTALTNGLVITVNDDGPVFTQQIISSLVDFSSGTSVTNSLNGAVGADENLNNLSSLGTKTYTFATYTDGPNSLYPNMDGVLSADKTQIIYYSTNVTAEQTAATALYQITLDQTGAGSYTFTSLANPPNLSFNFDFGNLPANQNLFGLIAAREGNIVDPGAPGGGDAYLPDGGVLVIAKGVALNTADGTYSNTSATINTSKASQITGATIGVSNQSFEGGQQNAPGDGAYFVYVNDPLVSSTSGLPRSAGGLTSTTADDADSIRFSGTIEVNTASVTVVQAQLQGNPFVGLRITAFDIPNITVSEANNNDRTFALDPVAGGTNVPINEIRVYAINPNTLAETLIEQWTFNSAGNVFVNTVNDSSIIITTPPNSLVAGQGFLSVDVTYATANIRIEFDTAAPHDAALIENVQGAFDLGAYSISQTTVIPDQIFDFTVKVTDWDSDINNPALNTFEEFSVTVNGSGTFNLNTISATDTDNVLTQPTRTISGFTSGGTDKLDFTVDATSANYAENLTPAATLAAYITAADAALNGTVDYYFGTVGSNGYLAYDDDNIGVTAIVQLIGVTNMDHLDII